MRHAILAPFLLALLALPGAAGEAFQELSYDEARSAAQRGERLVLIDFFTTWCAPCKKMDRTTWVDDRVVDWLGENAVAIKVDAEREVALAKRYGVKAYPTVVFARADGSEVARILGYEDAVGFLAVADRVPAAGAKVGAAQEVSADGDPDDPMTHVRRARELASLGQAEEAAKEFLWAFDHGAGRPDFASFRRSELLRELLGLSKLYPAVIDEIYERRERTEAVLLSPDSNVDAAEDYLVLNRMMGHDARNLMVYDLLVERAEQLTDVRAVLFRGAAERLIRVGRYEDYLAGMGDPEARLAELLAQYHAALEQAGDLGAQDPAVAAARDRIIVEVTRHFHALLGVERIPEARERADWLMEFDGEESRSYLSLMAHAVSAKAFSEARRIARIGMERLDGDEMKAVRVAGRNIPKSS